MTAGSLRTDGTLLAESPRMLSSRIIVTLCAGALLTLPACTATAPRPAPAPPSAPAPPQASTERTRFHATAYSIDGKTASGRHTREGIVAADPTVLPLGTRIRIHGAGAYDGEYTVTDTGRKIKGRDLDIYIADDAEAKRFGNKTVQVEVLEKGDGKRAAAR